MAGPKSASHSIILTSTQSGKVTQLFANIIVHLLRAGDDLMLKFLPLLVLGISVSSCGQPKGSAVTGATGAQERDNSSMEIRLTDFHPAKDLSKHINSSGSIFWSSFEFDGAMYALATVDTGSGAYIIHWQLFKKTKRKWTMTWRTEPVTMLQMPKVKAYVNSSNDGLTLFRYVGKERTLLHIVSDRK